jgi:hypothetical protein
MRVLNSLQCLITSDNLLQVFNYIENVRLASQASFIVFAGAPFSTLVREVGMARLVVKAARRRQQPVENNTKHEQDKNKSTQYSNTFSD